MDRCVDAGSTARLWQILLRAVTREHLLFDITVDLFNYGLAQQVQLSISVPNVAPKSHVKMLINQAIAADAAARGVSIGERSIWTLSDVAG